MGFRPAVCRIAVRLGVAGFIYNDTKGVTIEVQGDEKQIGEFLHALKSGPEQAAMAKIKSIDVTEVPVVRGEGRFVINKSKAVGAAVSRAHDARPIRGLDHDRPEGPAACD